MFFLLIFFGCIILFSFYSKKYVNPNKLIFIFGKKGSGKSTYMVKEMLLHLKNGWTVYTNMDEVSIPGVRVFDVEQLKSCCPDEHSVLFIDEAGLVWNNRGYKSFDSGYTEFFKLQRKYKCKVYVNSQSFDVDKKIRDLTDSMVLQTSIGNIIGVSRPIVRSIKLTEATADSDSRIADNLRFAGFSHIKFTWLPRYFKYFNSFNAPVRPKIKYREIIDDLGTLTAKTPVKAIKINLKGKQENEDT